MPPIYEYSCVSCDIKKEVLHSIKEMSEPTQETIKETTCGVCEYPMVRVVSLPAIIGQTDYRKMSPSAKEAFNSKMKKRSSEDFKKNGAEERIAKMTQKESI